MDPFIFNSLQSLVYDLGIVICSPDQHRRASTHSVLEEKGLGKHVTEILLKPGAMKEVPEKALEAKLPLIVYLIGICRGSTIGNALEARRQRSSGQE